VPPKPRKQWKKPKPNRESNTPFPAPKAKTKANKGRKTAAARKYFSLIERRKNSLRLCGRGYLPGHARPNISPTAIPMDS
jgi:hypothetical protein